MSLDIARRGSDGKWCVMDGLRVVFVHASQNACIAWLAVKTMAAEPDELPAIPAGIQAAIDSQNALIAKHFNVWGAYEIPRYGIDARVTHKPTGKLCVVRGYMAFTPPIVFYSLTGVDGMQLEEWASLSDIADPLEDTVVLTRE